MDKTTWFELPLGRDPYVPKKVKQKTEPLHILITDAGSKMAFALIYRICSGKIFGPEQEVILHLINAQGKVEHKGLMSEMEGCGFHLLKDYIVTAEPEEAYRDIDVAVVLMAGEEQYGFSTNKNIASNILKIRVICRNIVEYSKPDVKVIVTGNSIKLSLFALYTIGQLETSIPPENVTAVILVEQNMASGYLAGKLKTTVNNISGVYVWGFTCPDTYNATVLVYPPGDEGATEKKQMPVSVILNDDKWLRDDLVEKIYKRKLDGMFLRSGNAVATATGEHLRALFQGTEPGEIISMGILTPAGNSYLIPAGYPFSFPVVAGKGCYKVVENLKFDVLTHMHMIKAVALLESDAILNMNKIIAFIKETETARGSILEVHDKQLLEPVIQIYDWFVKYILSPVTEDTQSRVAAEKQRARKSIAWEDMEVRSKRLDSRRKSSLRFEEQESREQEISQKDYRIRLSSILKNPTESTDKLGHPFRHPNKESSEILQINLGQL